MGEGFTKLTGIIPDLQTARLLAIDRKLTRDDYEAKQTYTLEVWCPEAAIAEIIGHLRERHDIVMEEQPAPEKEKRLVRYKGVIPDLQTAEALTADLKLNSGDYGTAQTYTLEIRCPDGAIEEIAQYLREHYATVMEKQPAPAGR